MLHNGGMYYRDYIHIDDCVNGINLIAKNGDLNSIYKIIIILLIQNHFNFNSTIFLMFLLRYSLLILCFTR